MLWALPSIYSACAEEVLSAGRHERLSAAGKTGKTDWIGGKAIVWCMLLVPRLEPHNISAVRRVPDPTEELLQKEARLEQQVR